MSIVKTTGRVLAWFAFNAILYSLMALGFLPAFGWAWNLYAFLAWGSTILYGIMYGAKYQAIKEGKPETLAEYAKLKPPVPLWLDTIIDGLGLLALVAFGHWFFALLKIVEIVLYRGFYKTEVPHPVVQSE